MANGINRRDRKYTPQIQSELTTLESPDEEVMPDAPTVATQCSDNIDNDGDGSIDLDDPGCSSYSGYV